MTKLREYLLNESKPYNKSFTLNTKDKDYEDVFDQTMEFIKKLAEDNFPVYGKYKEDIPNNKLKVTINIGQLDKENLKEFLDEFETWSNSKNEFWYKTKLENQDLWIEPLKAEFRNGKLNVVFVWNFGESNKKKTNLKIKN